MDLSHLIMYKHLLYKMTIRYNTPFLRNLNKRRLSGLLLIYVLPTMIFSACQGQAPIQSADLVESNSIAAA